MAVSFVALGGTFTGKEGAAPALTIPAGTQVGDTLVVTMGCFLCSSYTPTSASYTGGTAGWSQIGAPASVQPRLYVFTKTATAADVAAAGTGTVTFSVNGGTFNSANGLNAAMLAYRGATQAPVIGLAAGQPPAVGLGQAVLGVMVGISSMGAIEATANSRTSQVATGTSNSYLNVGDWLPSGAHTAGPASASTPSRSATVVLTGNRAPNAPTPGSPANNATIDRGVTQRFAWTFSDPDPGDSQSAFDLQYRLVGASTWTTVSGTTPNQFYDFAAATLPAGNYEWQVRTYDAQGLVGPWSSSSFFTAASAPAQPTITAPINGSTVPNTTTLTWSAPSQTDYQWRRVADNAGAPDTTAVYYDSGDVVSSPTRSVAVAFDTNNRYEHLQVRIKNAGLWSTWADARVQVSYTPPTVATFTMTPDPTTATRTLTITNPAPGAGVPATAYNDVYVRTAASSVVPDTYRPYLATGIRIATALPTNTPWVDRTPAGSPVVYEYRVVSVAPNGATSDSGWQATG